MLPLKKITSYILIGIIMIFTIISILGVWEIIPLEDYLRKILLSLFIVFVAAVVVLFIFNVLLRNDQEED